MSAGVLNASVVLAHQCIVEFVSAVIRPRKDLDGAPLLTLEDARREAEEFTREFSVLADPFLTADGVHELPPLYAAQGREEASTARPRRMSVRRR